MNRFRVRQQYDETDDTQMGEASAIHTMAESRTQQQFAEDADINIIVHRFGVANEPLPPMPTDPRYYGEVEDSTDLGDMLRRVHDAKTRFNDLPSRLRNKFNNSPAQLWQWIHDEENADEAVKLGLLKRREPEATPPEPTPTPEPKKADA